ncbi:MAG: RHS repeat-associated core domain-containing protein [Sterolibacteriaceae bacterium]|nr:RHS repeat-associated core domain-containing protein [Sterolibacteriaceae bacterium]
MAPGNALATTDTSRYPEERLEALRQELASADGRTVDAHLRDYIDLYLALAEYPQRDATSSADLMALANEINDSLAFSRPEITTASTFAYVESLVSGAVYPSADPAVKAVHHAAEPVMMFNGQFVHASEDIRISGAGIEFVFQRFYKNQVTYQGPLGHNWDHSYNLWLRVSRETVFRSSGAFREDVYVRHPLFGQAGFSYWVPPDGQHGVIVEHGSSYVWRAPGGTRFIYEPEPARTDRHRIARIEDRHGNNLAFAYTDGRLQVVRVNHPERVVEFKYDTQDRITSIRDHTGRTWVYRYDDFGDLVAVTAPATPRHPDGLTASYEYSSSKFSGPLQHNLTRIADPLGQQYLENEYGSAPGLLAFNRVTRQRQGRGETSFEYEDVVQEFDVDYGVDERPAHQTNVFRRNGHAVHYVYNAGGNLLLKEESVVRDGRAQILQWRYRYNADGSPIGIMSPEGAVTQYYYGRDHYRRRYDLAATEVATHDRLTASERMAFGNLLAVARRGRRYELRAMNLARGTWGDFFPDVIAAVDPADVVTKFSYEATYQQMLTASDPRYTQSADPGHPETPRFQETVTRYEYAGPANDPNRYLARVRYADVRLPDETLLADIAHTYLDYDPRGRILRSADAAGVVTEQEYFDAASGVREGFLKRRTIDPGRLGVTTMYEVNALGLAVAITRPRAVGAPPGRFRTTYELDALNQVTRAVSSPPFSYETRWVHDRNGQVERVERTLVNEAGQPVRGGVEVKTFCYDDQKNLLHETIGGLDASTHLVTRYAYDESAMLVRITLPRGNVVTRTYEERLLQTSETRGARTPAVSTRHSHYGPDGRRAVSVDARGNATSYEYDALGRLVQTTDPLGNIARVAYDKADNVLVERFFERRRDGSYALLSRAEYQYDELGRRMVERRNLFQEPLPAADPATDFLAAPGPGVVLQHQHFYDRKGRLLRSVNRKGQATTFGYDALDRRILEEDALGNRTRFFYDAHDNLTRRDVHERVLDPLTNAWLHDDVFSLLHEYDELDRMVSTTTGLGNTIRFLYDSRNNLVGKIDPLGNVTRFDYDIYGRKLGETAEMTRSGLGAGGSMPPIVTTSEYDANGNVTATTDGKGNRTEQEYDALDRRTLLRYPDATTHEFAYDADGNVVANQDNNGLRRLFTVDGLGRVVRMRLDTSRPTPGVVIAGATFEEFEYDALRRVRAERNDFVEVDRRIDSLGRVYEETTVFPGAAAPMGAPRVIRRAFDDLGNPTELTYHGGRRVRFHLDTLNRVARVENVARGVAYPGSGAFAVQYDILHQEYRGLRRTRTVFANGATTSYAHDGDARIVQIAHTGPGAANVLTLQYLYDAANNVRRKHDITPLAAAAENYRYNSVYWVTKVTPDPAPVAFNPVALEPPAAPLPRLQLTGQTHIDALLGVLEQNPADFTFRFDGAGNREEERPAGQPARLYVPNGLDQYATAAGTQLTYDRNGNLIGDGQRRFLYDHRNQLATVKDPARARDVAAFFYDTRGRRVLSVEDGHTTHRYFDDQNIVEEYRDGVLWAQYVNEVGLDSARQIAVQGEEHWYHRDLVNSTRALTGPLGATSAVYVYDLFGSLLVDSNVANPNKFAGRRHDTVIGSYDFRARQYAPAWGRFYQRDPKGSADRSNLYAYAGNNPTVFNDPMGTERASLLPGQQEAALWQYVFGVPMYLFGSALNVFGGGEMIANAPPSEEVAIPNPTAGERAVNLIPLVVGGGAAGATRQVLGSGFRVLLAEGFAFGSTSGLSELAIHDIRKGEASEPLVYVDTAVDGGAFGALTAGLFGSLFVGPRMIYARSSYGRMQAAVDELAAEALIYTTLPPRYAGTGLGIHDLNEAMQSSFYETSRLAEGMALTPSRYNNNTGMDSVFRNFSGLEVEVAELKVIGDFKPGEIGKALGALRSTRYGVQGSSQYATNQVARILRSNVATPAMRQTARVIQNASQVNRTLVVMDELGNIYAFDLSFVEMLTW